MSTHSRSLFIWRSLAMVSWLLLALLVYVLIIGGDTQEVQDDRTRILLTPSDRALVLGEMRQFLGSIQGITQGLVMEDTTAIAEAARSVGNAAAQAVPASLMASLPLEFKTMGRSVHQAFDQLAMDAETLGDAGHSLQQMNAILAQCVACHARYQFAEK